MAAVKERQSGTGRYGKPQLNAFENRLYAKKVGSACIAKHAIDKIANCQDCTSVTLRG
jgi:hypothetical protein